MKLFFCAALACALSAQTFSGGPALDQAINDAIAQGRLPGAVLLIGHDGQVVYRKAYGRRAEVPQPENMTLDTVFDLASLTKVIATTSSMMKLFEQGKYPPQRQGHAVHPRVPKRQERRHHPQSLHAFFRAAP